ncbi:glutathione S-transferase family protein [Allomesorhizobium camelthorni]|uniref:Glutathione S-transferase family protein n=1 Tax=Allomesorhizobium camelthorni TaxID=475069 RepID=A0A6G4WF83_9HYPH|nr:glutathione S-transferase family protein [Mesorhizobium camelthorni]NGO52886.1 glutathione S-transferase family protein [Mesorhizobium camelthorni]
MYDLYIGNKNYSSWSLRPWVLMKTLGILFSEHLIPFHDHDAWSEYRLLSPNGMVPLLGDGNILVWDSLSIAEYLAERHEGVWPSDPAARAFARSAAAEMHSGFPALRNICGMNIGVRVKLHQQPDALKANIARLSVLWNDGISRFGGPFLAGPYFSAADAFFCPVAFRVQTYGLELDATSAAYVARLLGLPAMREWYAGGLAETFRDWPHEHEIDAVGTVTEDLRAPASN